MWTHAIVMSAPLFDDDLCLAQRRKYLPVQQLVAQSTVETLHIAVLPRAAALDVGRARTNRPNPPLHGLSNELRSPGPSGYGPAPRAAGTGRPASRSRPSS